jgi:hypothetical protein
MPCTKWVSINSVLLCPSPRGLEFNAITFIVFSFILSIF